MLVTSLALQAFGQQAAGASGRPSLAFAGCGDFISHRGPKNTVCILVDLVEGISRWTPNEAGHRNALNQMLEPDSELDMNY